MAAWKDRQWLIMVNTVSQLKSIMISTRENGYISGIGPLVGFSFTYLATAES